MFVVKTKYIIYRQAGDGCNGIKRYISPNGFPIRTIYFRKHGKTIIRKLIFARVNEIYFVYVIFSFSRGTVSFLPSRQITSDTIEFPLGTRVGSI